MPGSPSTGGVLSEEDWSSAITPGMVTGFSDGYADRGSGGVVSGITQSIVSGEGAAPLWSPDNPLFWFGALLLGAVGAITLSTSVDLGPLKGKAKI